MNLIAGFSEKLSNKMVDKGIVPEEEVELYLYGIENGIILTGNLVASIILGMITGKLNMVLVFLLFCVTLRSYSGGIHSKNKLICFILSLLILLVPVYTYSYFFKVMKAPWIFMIGIVSFLVIWLLSPIESENKPLDDVEQRVYKKASHCILCIQSGILILLFGFDLKEYFYAGYCSIILIAIFMIMGKFRITKQNK